MTKASSRIERNRNSFAGILLMAVGILVWANPETFLWRDDWLFLQFFHTGSYALFRNHFATDVMPLFQYILFAEFSIFGTAFHYHQLVNVILLTVCSIAVYHLLLAFELPYSFALLGSLLYLVHPTNFVNAFWIIQQCELIHIFLVLLSFLAYRKYTVSPGIARLGGFTICLFLQSFFFPNGAFYALMFIVLELLRGRRNLDRRLITITGLIFLLHMAYALFISQGLPIRESTALQDTIPDKIIFFLSFAANSITRLVVPNTSYSPQTITHWLGLIALIGIIVRTLHYRKQNELLLPAVLALFSASISLSVFRSSNTVIPHYYTSLQMPFLIIILVSLIHSTVKGIHRRGFNIFWIVILVVFAYGDRTAKRIFADRNNANRQQLEHAVSSGKPYEPADDPALEMPGYISINGKSSGETAVILYEQLRSMDH